MNPITAIAAFGVPEQQVDALIESITLTVAEPVRWVVFGTDMNLLAALDRQWSGSVELVLACLPAADGTTIEAAHLILENEGLDPSVVAWLHGDSLPCEPPMGFRATLKVGRAGIEPIRDALVSFAFSATDRHPGTSAAE